MRKAQIVSSVLSNKFAVIKVSKQLMSPCEGFFVQDLVNSTAIRVNAKSAKSAIQELMNTGNVAKAYTSGTLGGKRKAMIMFQTVESL